ncbi:transcription elongation factor GreA [Candidatus Beckwithbacteria bacterium]|nr:transcription elongation factor GreA [Candidatus Beckwithbacteria bacterium]
MVKNQNDSIYLTKQGLSDLKGELDELKNKKRPVLLDRVSQAREQGDLSENSEYANSKEELTIVDGRIEELEDIIAKAKIITDQSTNHNKVKIGSKVKVKINDDHHIYTVVGEWEADPMEKKISHDSPLGKALLNRKKGDKVDVNAPAGKITYEIVEID